MHSLLTIRQREVLTFIKNYIQTNHHAPTHAIISTALKINSCSFLNRILHKLETSGFIKRGLKRHRRNIMLQSSPYSLPLLGKIAAGKPIEAIKQNEEILLMQKLIGENRYLLEVKGDSMIEDNICDGDWIICESTPKAINGTIVVALIHGEEATLKRIFYEQGRIKLEPANKNYKSQYYKSEEIIVQAKFIGLIRLT